MVNFYGPMAKLTKVFGKRVIGSKEFSYQSKEILERFKINKITDL